MVSGGPGGAVKEGRCGRRGRKGEDREARREVV